MIRYLFKTTEITVKTYRKNFITPNREDITEILKENHKSPVSGHTGFYKTYHRIKQKYTWENMKISPTS